MSLFLITLSVSMANIMMLEFMQQIESGEKTSLFKALKEAVVLDFLKVIPVSLIWTFVWFILLILRAATSKKREGKRAEPSVRDAALPTSLCQWNTASRVSRSHS